MNDHNLQDDSSGKSGAGDFSLLKPPFTKEAMLEEFYNSVYHWAQALGFAIGNAPVLRLLAPEGTERDYDWEAELPENPATPKVIEQLRTWDVTAYLERLYDYGILGITYDSYGSMDSESKYTYVCAFIEDLMNSRVHDELEAATGRNFYPRMALEAAQTALARQILEEDRELFYAFGGQGREGELTIRDVALLARMEEKSVRNAANPKRPGHLKTRSKDGSTYVEPADAREWLKARGRYIPLTRGYAEAEINLESTTFRSVLDAWQFIVARYRSLALTADEFGKLVGLEDLRDPPQDEARHLDPDDRVNWRFAFTIGQARNAGLMRRFARALELPAELFVLRMREAAASDELAELRSSINALNAQRG